MGNDDTIGSPLSKKRDRPGATASPPPQHDTGPPVRVESLVRVKPAKGPAIWQYVCDGSVATVQATTLIEKCPSCGTTTTWDQFRDKKKGDWRLLTCTQKCRGAKKPKREQQEQETIDEQQATEKKLTQAERAAESAKIAAAAIARQVHKITESPEMAREADVYARIDSAGGDSPKFAAEAKTEEPLPLWVKENRRSILRRFGLYRSAGIADKTYWTAIVCEDVRIEVPVLEFRGDEVVVSTDRTQVIEGIDALVEDNRAPQHVALGGKTSEKPRLELQEPKNRELGFVDVGYFRGKHEANRKEARAAGLHAQEAEFIGRHQAVAHYDFSWNGSSKQPLRCEAQFSVSDQLRRLTFRPA